MIYIGAMSIFILIIFKKTLNFTFVLLYVVSIYFLLLSLNACIFSTKASSVFVSVSVCVCVCVSVSVFVLYISFCPSDFSIEFPMQFAYHFVP